MKSLLSSEVVHVLGWTLLHSLWQSLVVLAIAMAILRVIPGKHSSIRYIITTMSLLLVVAISVSTFVVLSENTNTVHYPSPAASPSDHATAYMGSVATSISWLDDTTIIVGQYMPFIVIIWFIGSLLFTLRLGGSWIFITRLKRKALPLQNEWSERVRELALQLGVLRHVNLAMSSQIHVPAVIGYFKPVILIPVGMFSGLSTEQVEAIFIHELAHIKRHDYLVNVIQSFVEALFFFNPFVWILSGMIRREREHCCDDMVISFQHNPRMYALALAHLEEMNVSQPVLSLSLLGHKNELLNRIKRIMEKSVKNYSGRERVIPVLLMVLGITCASWLSVNQAKDDAPVKKTSTAASDTTIKNKEGNVTYTRTRITTTGADGKPHTEVIEEYNGDADFSMPFREAGTPAVAPHIPDFSMDLPDIAPLPDFTPALAGIDAIGMPADFFSALPPMPPTPSFNWNDTIPHPNTLHTEEWQAFSQAFEKKFKEQFGDFYEAHARDIEKMMQDVQSNFSNEWEKEFSAKAKEMERYFQSDEWRQQEHAMRDLEKKSRDMQIAAFEAQHAADMHNHKAFLERDMVRQQHQLRAMEEQLREMESNMKEFESALKKELVKDGYIKSDEKINSIQIDDDGAMQINGKSIKDKDKAKYRNLHKKYFKSPRAIQHSEE
jgi:beta-lactamase regulating signal transducer with metallopeptidase domain